MRQLLNCTIELRQSTRTTIKLKPLKFGLYGMDMNLLHEMGPKLKDVRHLFLGCLQRTFGKWMR